MKNLSYTAIILKELLDGKTLKSSDKYFVNANQYFVEIKNNGIELIEVWKPNKKGRGNHKERRLNQSIENIKKALKLFFKLTGKKYTFEEEN